MRPHAGEHGVGQGPLVVSFGKMVQRSLLVNNVGKIVALRVGRRRAGRLTA